MKSMKKIKILILLSCIAVGLCGCDDYNDFTSKHVYGDTENPYLRVDAEAKAAINMEFEVGRFEAQIVKLDDYSDKFQNEMNMTVDQVIAGLKNGSILFYNINASKGNWDKSEMTKGTTGWYYNTAGGVMSDSETQTASLDIDTEAKTLIVNVNEQAKAGTILNFNVGFAIDGPDYDRYVRFAFNVSVTDPSLIIASVSIPEGDYSNTTIDFNDYAETISYNLGLSVEEFLAKLDTETGGSIHMSVINIGTGEWDVTSDYTANPPGYWINNLGAVCSWNDAGFSMFAETNSDDQVLFIGRAPALSAGTNFTIGLGYKDIEDETKFFSFIISVTLE